MLYNGIYSAVSNFFLRVINHKIATQSNKWFDKKGIFVLNGSEKPKNKLENWGDLNK